MALLSLGPASTGLALDSLDCGIALASTAKPSHGLIEGRRLAAPRVMDRPRLVGWSSLCHARPRRLTSLVVARAPRLPVPCRWRSWSGSRISRCVHPGIDPYDQDRPAPVPSGTKRVEIGTPSVVSRADQGFPRPPPSRLPSFRRVPRAARTVLTPRRASAACVSTPCEAPRGQRPADDLPCGSSCVTARDASDRLLPSLVFVRAPAPRGFPTSVTRLTLVLVGGPPGSRQRGSLRRTAPSVSSWCGALSSPRHVCGRASDTPVAPSTTALCAHALVAVAVAAEADPHRPREAVPVGERPEMPSVRQGPLPRDALSGALARAFA
jgi:hypothetical protein